MSDHSGHLAWPNVHASLMLNNLNNSFNYCTTTRADLCNDAKSVLLWKNGKLFLFLIIVPFFCIISNSVNEWSHCALWLKRRINTPEENHYTFFYSFIWYTIYNEICVKIWTYTHHFETLSASCVNLQANLSFCRDLIFTSRYRND